MEHKKQHNPCAERLPVGQLPVFGRGRRQPGSEHDNGDGAGQQCRAMGWRHSANCLQWNSVASWKQRHRKLVKLGRAVEPGNLSIVVSKFSEQPAPVSSIPLKRHRRPRRAAWRELWRRLWSAIRRVSQADSQAAFWAMGHPWVMPK